MAHGWSGVAGDTSKSSTAAEAVEVSGAYLLQLEADLETEKRANVEAARRAALAEDRACEAEAKARLELKAAGAAAPNAVA